MKRLWGLQLLQGELLVIRVARAIVSTNFSGLSNASISLSRTDLAFWFNGFMVHFSFLAYMANRVSYGIDGFGNRT